MGRRSQIALSAAVSAALLAVAFFRADWGVIESILSRSEPRWAVLAVVALSAAYLTHCLRWKVLLDCQGSHQSVRTLLPFHYAGLLANLLLPAQFGLDAVRIIAGRRLLGSRTAMAAVVLADRIVGAWSVGAVAALGAALLPPGDRPLWALPLALTVVLAVSLLALLALRMSSHTALHSPPPGEEPSAWRRVLTKWAEVGGRFEQRRGHLALVGGLAALQIALLGLSVGLVAHALDVPLTLQESVLVFPAIALAIMLAPITIGGHGLREMLFPLALVPLGLGNNEALALAIAWFALTVLASIPGAFAWSSLRWSPFSPSRPRSD